eukprot:TRINITY_DN3266_c0_g1_i4.p1 TRINITY_DN3266_c0_g1~~TRINITY_DN3266_c0_g1_i4.p1  ORF type:complete len:491 (-),score=121.57 TRINITY_DN3266_c0_g1_i4:759-2231(-)
MQAMTLLTLTLIRHVIFTVAFATAAAADSVPVRKLSHDKIAGYEPASNVVPHSRIDLDQKEFESHLKSADYGKAQNIYTLGGNSGGTATIVVGKLSKDAAKGAVVKQGGVTKGYMKSAAAAGSTSLTVSYTSTCKDGGSSSKDTSGCFTLTDVISIVDVGVGNASAVVNKYRTLAGFSTAAETKMALQEYYVPYKSYYKAGDYAHQMVLAALGKTGICASCDDTARDQVAKKTTAYMNVWMYIIREMEDALQDCKSGCLQCNDDPVHAWDEGWAFYAGSLEGKDVGGSSSGKLVYRLAEKRCANFGTCTGANGANKISAVNDALLPLFQKGQLTLLQGKCAEVVPIKRRIVELMSVPLVQGALRYAYKVAKLSGGSKEKAEGAVFAAAILPRIAKCDAGAAKVISDNMKMDSSKPMASGFQAVKTAFEQTYKCLGITCKDVGGLISVAPAYFEGAGPCSDVETATSSAYQVPVLQPFLFFVMVVKLLLSV